MCDKFGQSQFLIDMSIIIVLQVTMQIYCYKMAVDIVIIAVYHRIDFIKILRKNGICVLFFVSYSKCM